MNNKSNAINKIMTEIKSSYPQLSSARIKIIRKYVEQAYEEGFSDGYDKGTEYSL